MTWGMGQRPMSTLTRETCPTAQGTASPARRVHHPLTALDLARSFTAWSIAPTVAAARGLCASPASTARHEKQGCLGRLRAKAPGHASEAQAPGLLREALPYSLIYGIKVGKPHQCLLSGRFHGQKNLERKPSGKTTRP